MGPPYIMTTTPTTLELLQAAKSRSGLAKLLQIEHSQLTYILYKKSDVEKYKTFDVPKRGGGLRTISAPTPELKLLQRRLSDVLNMCAVDVENSTGRINFSAHGFKINRSILTNAAVHRNKRFVFNVDLKDFFPTISAKRIRGYLINDKYYKVAPEVATTIAHIACRDGLLTQGAPSSPVISNLIAGILDFHLTRLAKNCGCRYTRYADDITFSTNKKDFPKEIARLVAGQENKWELGGALIKLISKSGFEINHAKTRMQYKNSRQQVTGLVVNKKLNVTEEYRKLARAYVFSLITHGKYTIANFGKDAAGNVVKEVKEGTHAQLHGILGFIHSVDNVFRADLKNNPQNYSGRAAEAKSGDQKLQIFRRFLFYTNFYCNSAPLIVCEGKTDNVYISSAVHQSKKLFPQLVKNTDDENDVLSFFLMKYDRKHKKRRHIHLPNFSTVSILGVGSGGVDNLKNLLLGYKAEISRFKANPGAHPVIFIVDNDHAGKKVFSAAVQISNPKIDNISGDEKYINIHDNIYIVPIPKVKKPHTSIEDLFFDKDVPPLINGKPLIFSNDNEKGTAGKADFAFEHVVKNAETIDWSGFYPLLNNICEAIEHRKAIVGGKI